MCSLFDVDCPVDVNPPLKSPARVASYPILTTCHLISKGLCTPLKHARNSILESFGINSKIGAKDTFEIQLDNNVDAIYFYTGNGGYKKVLEKESFDKLLLLGDILPHGPRNDLPSGYAPKEVLRYCS